VWVDRINEKFLPVLEKLATVSEKILHGGSWRSCWVGAANGRVAYCLFFRRRVLVNCACRLISSWSSGYLGVKLLFSYNFMAVDYFHRLLLTGRHEAVRRLVSAFYREYAHTIGRQTCTDVVPFSFEALYDLAPSAIPVEREVPCDPYELAAWPIRKRTKAASEASYQFQTRNLEMAPFTRLLARTDARLTFTLVTLCLNDSSIESHCSHPARRGNGRFHEGVGSSTGREGTGNSN
jgi:hypothetical protein